MRHTNRKVCAINRKNKVNRNGASGNTNIGLTDKDGKSTIINMFKGLKENMSKELKEDTESNDNKSNNKQVGLHQTKMFLYKNRKPSTK